MDIKGSFLNDNLEKNIYMSQLEGFIGIRFGAKDLHLWVKPGNQILEYYI